MARLRAIYGFPVSCDYRYRLAGKKYRLGKAGVQALKFLAHLAQQSQKPHTITWLLPHRGHVRELQRNSPRAALAHVIDRTDCERLRLFAIWLRGRCGGTLGIPTIADYGSVDDKSLRKEATRCLKRMSAWPELRQIVKNESDPRIRRMAAQAPPEPHAARLAAFSARISPRVVTRRTSRLVVSPALDVSQGRPAKTRSMIRDVLERIHRLVRRSAR